MGGILSAREENDPKYSGVRAKFAALDNETKKLAAEFVIETTNAMVDDFVKEQKRQETEIKKILEELKKLRNIEEKLRNDNQILLSEKESALTRLSKIAGIQLTKGNSDIADLSDVNRPTNLAEQYSSLYTEEWIDAYDEMSMKGTINTENNKCEKELCKIITECYAFCQSLERKQMTDIKAHAWDIACSLHQQPDQLVSAARTTQYHKLNKDSINGQDVKAAATVSNQQGKPGFEVTILAIQQCMEELVHIVHERRKYDKKLLEYVKQETVRQFQQYNKPESKGAIINYVRKCAELCWNMVIKNPPMILVYDHMEGKPVDQNMFSLFTKKGQTIDFVVWPALKLQQEGPILHKGVVQGKEDVQPDIRTLANEKNPTTGKEFNNSITTRGGDIQSDPNKMYTDKRTEQ